MNFYCFREDVREFLKSVESEVVDYEEMTMTTLTPTVIVEGFSLTLKGQSVKIKYLGVLHAP